MVTESDVKSTLWDYYEMDFFGPMSNEDKAEISWLDLDASKGELDWKVLVDFWAWAAWFFSSLDIKDAHIHEVDPVYASREQFEKIKQWTVKNFTELVNELLTYRQTETIRRGIKRYTSLIIEASQAEYETEDQNVTRSLSIEEVPDEADVIFSSYIFNSLDDPDLLWLFSERLTDDWKVVIVDTRSQWIIKFLLRNIRSFKGVTVRKNDLKSTCIIIERKALKRVCTTLKRYKK